MLIESLTFKYIVKLFEFFKLNQLNSTSIKVFFLDIDKIYSANFTDYSSLLTYYNANYLRDTSSACTLGRYAYISNFSLVSNLYNFKLTFTANDVCKDSFKLNIGYPYDKKRLSLIENFINKQKFLIEQNLSTYCTYSTKFKKIYLEEVYSPCYAEPGWNLGTSNIKIYRDLVNELDYRIYKN